MWVTAVCACIEIEMKEKRERCNTKKKKINEILILNQKRVEEGKKYKSWHLCSTRWDETFKQSKLRFLLEIVVHHGKNEAVTKRWEHTRTKKYLSVHVVYDESKIFYYQLTVHIIIHVRGRQPGRCVYVSLTN